MEFPAFIPGRSPARSGSEVPQSLRDKSAGARTLVAWSSFLFAILQSVCTVFTAVSGLRLLIGISSLAISAGAGAALDRFHANWIRVPMISFAFIGLALNLSVLLQIWRLRNRSASRWRQKPVSRHTLNVERLQMLLSVATLILIVVEEYLHFCEFRSL